MIQVMPNVIVILVEKLKDLLQNTHLPPKKKEKEKKRDCSLTTGQMLGDLLTCGDLGTKV